MVGKGKTQNEATQWDNKDKVFPGVFLIFGGHNIDVYVYTLVFLLQLFVVWDISDARDPEVAWKFGNQHMPV